MWLRKQVVLMVAVLEMEEWEGTAGWVDCDVDSGYCSCFTVTGGRVDNVSLSLISSSLLWIVCRVFFTYTSNTFVFSSQFIDSNFSALQVVFCCSNWGFTRKYRSIFSTYWIKNNKKEKKERKANRHTAKCQSELNSEHIVPGVVIEHICSQHCSKPSSFVHSWQCTQSNCIKLKMGGHKSRNYVNWQGLLEQKGV